MNLVEFLLARIEEDETEARVVSPTIRGYVSYADGRDARRVARVLAECDAKRRIIDWHDLAERQYGPRTAAGILEILALPYAEHPDYRDEWRP